MSDEVRGVLTFVLLGIVPTHPETGFGYIRTGEPVSGSSLHRVDAGHSAEAPAVRQE